jgi:Nucleotidyl transferase AbiEii toxin, Type IV TA system
VSHPAGQLDALIAAVAVFDEGGIRYALIGGLAVGIVSGVPRATLDVDFAIPSDVDRRALAERFERHGFALSGEFAHSMNFEHESGEPVQLALDAEFDPMIARAEPVTLDDLMLNVVTKADLLAMKRRAAADPARRRSKALRDQADIALLEGDVPEPNEGW